MSTTVTIAVPTHNRARLLGGTLASIAALNIPEGVNPECLIVDNNSPDDTRDVVEVFAREAPMAVRYVVEPQLGSSYARNRAIAEARGEYIFFIDDDALAEPDWAIELLGESPAPTRCGMRPGAARNGSGRRRDGSGRASTCASAVHDHEAATCRRSRGRGSHPQLFQRQCRLSPHDFQTLGSFREDLGVVGNNPISGEERNSSSESRRAAAQSDSPCAPASIT